MPLLPQEPDMSVFESEDAFFERKRQYECEMRRYPEVCALRARQLRGQIQKATLAGGHGERHHAVFELELLPHPFEGCGFFQTPLLWFATTCCRPCCSRATDYSEAKYRDALRRWLMRARIERKENLSATKTFHTLQANVLSKDSGEGTTGRVDDPIGNGPVRPSSEVRRTSTMHRIHG